MPLDLFGVEEGGIRFTTVTVVEEDFEVEDPPVVKRWLPAWAWILGLTIAGAAVTVLSVYDLIWR